MKAPIIALTLVTVGSLATSGYLLIERKANAKLIVDAQAENKNQRGENLKLLETKTKAEKQFNEAKSNLTIATNNLAKVQQELTEEKSQSQTQLAELQTQLNEAGIKETTLNGELETRDSKITQLAADQNATQTKLKAAETQLAARLTELQEREAELATSVEALKPFLATGLSPEDIAALKAKRPLEIPGPNLTAPTPIRPGKLSKPLTAASPVLPPAPPLPTPEP